MKYLKQDDIKDDYDRYVVITRKPDTEGLPDDTTSVSFVAPTEGKAHHLGQLYSDVGYFVDTYYVIGRNERTGTEL